MGTFFSHACVLSFGDGGAAAAGSFTRRDVETVRRGPLAHAGRIAYRPPRPPRVEHCHMRRPARIPIADHRTRARESILRIPTANAGRRRAAAATYATRN